MILYVVLDDVIWLVKFDIFINKMDWCIVNLLRWSNEMCCYVLKFLKIIDCIGDENNVLYMYND